MNEIIKVSMKIIGANEVNSVNARELWQSLEIKKQFGNWINHQIKTLGLDKNIDFSTFNQKVKRVGTPLSSTKKEYIITLDSAKHIAMASRTEKGKEIRTYFIQVEKKLKEIEIKKYNDYNNLNNKVEKFENMFYDMNHYLRDMNNTLKDISKKMDLETQLQNDNIIVNSEKIANLENAKTHFQISKRNKNDNLKNKEKFYQDILKVIANHPDGASQRTLLAEAGYSQSKKIRRWLQEQISILWDMTIIPGKCYKYVLKNNI